MRVVMVLLLLAIAACTSHPRKLDCEAHLVPINPAAPLAKAGEEGKP
jgi:hypothetical protein